MADYSIIGTNMQRVDAIDKATGQSRYTADLILPRMLYGKVLRSSLPHAKILHIDTSRAAKLPGVKAVIIAIQKYYAGDELDIDYH